MSVENSMKPCDEGQWNSVTGARVIACQTVEMQSKTWDNRAWESLQDILCQTETQGFKFVSRGSAAELSSEEVNDLKAYLNNPSLETHFKSITRIKAYMGL